MPNNTLVPSGVGAPLREILDPPLIKVYIGKSIIHSTEKLPPVGIEPGTSSKIHSTEKLPPVGIEPGTSSKIHSTEKLPPVRIEPGTSSKIHSTEKLPPVRIEPGTSSKIHSTGKLPPVDLGSGTYPDAYLTELSWQVLIEGSLNPLFIVHQLTFELR